MLTDFTVMVESNSRLRTVCLSSTVCPNVERRRLLRDCLVLCAPQNGTAVRLTATNRQRQGRRVTGGDFRNGKSGNTSEITGCRRAAQGDVVKGGRQVQVGGKQLYRYTASVELQPTLVTALQDMTRVRHCDTGCQGGQIGFRMADGRDEHCHTCKDDDASSWGCHSIDRLALDDRDFPFYTAEVRWQVIELMDLL